MRHKTATTTKANRKANRAVVSATCALLLAFAANTDANETVSIGFVNGRALDRECLVEKNFARIPIAPGAFRSITLSRVTPVPKQYTCSASQSTIDTAIRALHDKTTFSIQCNDGSTLMGQLCFSGALAPSMNGSHMCLNQGLTGSTQLKCTGSNIYSQLGLGAVTTNQRLFTAVSGAENILGFCGGERFSCIIRSDRRVACVGGNGIGQGSNSATSFDTLQDIKSVDGQGVLENIYKITCGGAHVCVLDNNSQWICWGSNGFGQVDSTKQNQFLPVRVGVQNMEAGDKLIDISNGFAFSCARSLAGFVWCFGDNRFGQLSIGTTMNVAIPTRLLLNATTLLIAKSIVCGAFHMCATDSNAALLCSGRNDAGQLGSVGSKSYMSPPTGNQAMILMSGVKTMALGFDHTCVIPSMSQGILCTGSNAYGQLGRNSNVTSFQTFDWVPSLINTEIREIAAGGYHTIVLLKNLTLMSFGDNRLGQLGAGDIVNRIAPVAISQQLFSSSLCGASFYSLSRNGDPCGCTKNVVSSQGIVTIRPDSGDANWGGFDGLTCGAMTQTLAISLESNGDLIASETEATTTDSNFLQTTPTITTLTQLTPTASPQKTDSTESTIATTASTVTSKSTFSSLLTKTTTFTNVFSTALMNSTSSLAIYAGVGAGAALLLLIVIVAILFIVKRRRRNRAKTVDQSVDINRAVVQSKNQYESIPRKANSDDNQYEHGDIVLGSLNKANRDYSNLPIDEFK